MTENEVTDVGGRVGPRIAKLLMDAVAGTQMKLGDHKNGLAQQILADFTNHVSDEVTGLWGNFLKDIVNNPDLPEDLRPAFTALATERGQAYGWIAGSMASSTMSAGIMDIISNHLAPLVHSIVAQNPNTFLAPETAAAAMARGLDFRMGARSLSYDALGAGINPERFETLIDLARAYPTVNQTQDLVNRGIWPYDVGVENLVRIGFMEHQARNILNMREVLLSAEQLAVMANRDVVTAEEGRERAEQAGVSGEDFDKLVEIYGEPLGVASLGEAFRRGIITRERFLRGVVQGPLRREWFDVVDKLLYSRMSTVDAADAVNQGHMNLGAAQEIAQANGLEPEDFATLIQTAGAPPGVDFITEALNRRLIDTETFNSAFFESRIKNKYVGLFEQMRYRLIPQETVRLLYRNGVYSQEATLETLRMHGFTEDDAQALLLLEERRQDEGTKELTRSQIIQLYTVRAIDLATTLSFLLDLGYTEANAQAMISLADFTRMRTFVNSATTRLKAAYLAGRMDETTVVTSLDALGISPDERDDLLTIWDIDKTTISKTLTASQIRQAVGKNLMSAGEAVSRLTAQGYDAEDATLFLQLTA